MKHTVVTNANEKMLPSLEFLLLRPVRIIERWNRFVLKWSTRYYHSQITYCTFVCVSREECALYATARQCMQMETQYIYTVHRSASSTSRALRSIEVAMGDSIDPTILEKVLKKERQASARGGASLIFSRRNTTPCKSIGPPAPSSIR